jgi:hypothetical protein
MYGPERTEILIACRNFDPNSDNFAILYDSAVALAKKEAKRRKPHWKLATETILVLELVDRFHHEYQAYQGLQQNWPTAPGAFVEMKAGIPVYYGYQPRPYIVLGQLQEVSMGRCSLTPSRTQPRLFVKSKGETPLL